MTERHNPQAFLRDALLDFKNQGILDKLALSDLQRNRLDAFIDDGKNFGEIAKKEGVTSSVMVPTMRRILDKAYKYKERRL